MVRTLLFCMLLIGRAGLALGQVGGNGSFAFTEVPIAATTTAIGGENVSWGTDDVTRFRANPALLNESVHNRGAVSFMPYYADIYATHLAYANKWRDKGSYGVSFSAFSYGTMRRTDAGGNEEGDFYAGDYELAFSHARKVDFFTLGVSGKVAGSQVAGYSAFAALFDIGGHYRHPTQDLTVGMVIKNVGVVMKKFHPGSRALIPFDVQVGASYKPEHMPVRLSLTAHHLYRYKVAYDTPLDDVPAADGSSIDTKEPGVGENIARHFVAAAEFVMSDKVSLLTGYNYMRRKELRLLDAPGVAGFSLGIRIKMKTFDFAFSRSFFHAAGGKNSFTLVKNFDASPKKRKPIGATSNL